MAGSAPLVMQLLIASCWLLEKRADWTQADKGRVARCLKALHYERFKGGPRNAREWRYGPRRTVSQS